MCLAALPAAQDHLRRPRRRAWHTVGALAEPVGAPRGGAWRDPVGPLCWSPRPRVLAAGRRASPVGEPSLADPYGTGWGGGRLCEVTAFFLRFSWISPGFGSPWQRRF